MLEEYFQGQLIHFIKGKLLDEENKTFKKFQQEVRDNGQQ